jgi:hypothetical protein
VFVHVPVPGKEHVLFYAISALLACFGIYDLCNGLNARKPVNVDAAQLEQGIKVSGIWLRVRGQALWGERATQDQESGRVRYVVPVISGQPGSRQRVALFLDYQNAIAEPHGATAPSVFEGIVSDAYLLGTKDDFHHRGLHESEHFIVLTPGGTPRDVIGRAKMFFAMSGGALLLAALLVWLRRRGWLPKI